jgi:hypothetical protein
MCTSPRIIAHLTVLYDVAGLEQGAPVTFCQLKAPDPKDLGAASHLLVIGREGRPVICLISRAPQSGSANHRM